LTDLVAQESAIYKAQAEAWALPRALMGGTRAMREAGKTYLPQEPAESDRAYQIRLRRSTLFNGYEKTVGDMSAKVFAKPIALGDDVPGELATWAENIDLAGRNLQVFGLHVLADAMQAGIGFLLVDMPTPLKAEDLGREPTLADEQKAGARPYLCHVRAEDLIGFKSETIAGVETVTQVRIRECVEEEDPDNPFEKRKVTQIRVLYPGGFEIWRQIEEQWRVVSSGATSLAKITIVPVYLNRTGFFQGSPPLQNLADLNVAHWQSASDQRNILHAARVPILFGSGIPEDAPPVQIGAAAMTRSSDPHAKLVFVEHSGAAIGAGRDDLKDLEAQMQALGLELVMPKSGSVTATGEALDAAAMNAPLAIMAQALQDALEAAFGLMAEYAGLKGNADKLGGSLTVNKDFGVSMRDAADLTALQSARNAGDITAETLLREFKRRGVLSDEVDPETEVEKAKDDMPLGFMLQKEAADAKADNDDEDDPIEDDGGRFA
jgi:hypothetical protein